jgi:hypothetical protein
MEERGQAIDSAAEVAQANVRVASGQGGGGVSGKFLQGSQVDAGPRCERDVAVAEGMEVGVFGTVRAFDSVGDAGGGEVNA